MCRNITELRGLEPAATREEIEAAAAQYIRKVTGISRPNPALADAMQVASLEVADITERLLAGYRPVVSHPRPSRPCGAPRYGPAGAQPDRGLRSASDTPLPYWASATPT